MACANAPLSITCIQSCRYLYCLLFLGKNLEPITFVLCIIPLIKKKAGLPLYYKKLDGNMGDVGECEMGSSYYVRINLKRPTNPH